MTFHYAVTLTVPDDADGPPDRQTYRNGELALLSHLRQACAEIATAPVSTWTVEPMRPNLEPAGLVEIPFYPNLAELEKRHLEKFELAQMRRGGALDRPDQINIDARHSTIHQAENGKQKFARCGNCGARYEITEDPTENHHRAMQHKQRCGKGSEAGTWTEDEHAQLVEEFQNQPMQIAFRSRAAAEIAGGANPARLALTGVNPLPNDSITGERQGRVPQLTGAPSPKPARWWQFWKWFR